MSALADGSCSISVSSESEAVAANIRELLNRRKVGHCAPHPGDLTEARLLDAAFVQLKAVLAEAGYYVEVLPVSEHKFAFVLDMQTGEMIGTHTSRHEATSPGGDDIARMIFESIATKFKEVQDELADQIIEAVAQGLHADAVELICQGYESGGAEFAPTLRLLEALQSVDLTAATDDQCKTALSWRTNAAQALGKADVAAVAAQALLSGWGHTFTVEQTGALRMILAVGAMQRGSKEAALMIWRELLDDPRSLGVDNRGWAWRNISFALAAEDPEALRAARYSADAFLEAGDKKQAAKSLMRVANVLLHSEPTKALSAIDEIMPLLDSDDLAYRPIRAATLHARADRLMKLGRYREATEDARLAVAGWRGLVGTEPDLTSSLYLAAFAAELHGDKVSHAQLKAEADELAATLSTSHFALGNRLIALSKHFSSELAQQLTADAENAGEYDVVASVQHVRATLDIGLGEHDRLMLLEEGLAVLERADRSSPMVAVLQVAIGNQLTNMSQFGRARSWYEKALKREPDDEHARDGLLNCLRTLGAWADAVAFLKSQVALRGEMPGLMFAYGQAMYESGDMPGAFRTLKKAASLAESDFAMKAQASALAERALELAGAMPPLPVVTDPRLPVTLEEFDAELTRFGMFVAAAKRMMFWTKSEGADYMWIARPERQAQHMLHTFLKARFLDRIEMFEEIATGAGRLDLYVQLFGGLSAVVELKMCGFGYSSAYAAAGEEQISHYMGNRPSAIGYLVVFDARLEGFAVPLTAMPHQNTLTIKTHFVDVRPRVSARSNRIF